jgi:hypothetical protein
MLKVSFLLKITDSKTIFFRKAKKINLDYSRVKGFRLTYKIVIKP